jgi:exodeoxyribonuclease VIII
MSKDKYLPLSFSSLKAFNRSPLQFIEYKENKKEPTPAMMFGTLVHRALLEPEKYSRTVAVWEGGRRGTNAHKHFVAANEGKDIITATEAMDIRALCHRVEAHPYAGAMLKQCQKFEVPFEIEQCGVPHRGIIDGLGSWFMLDLKTTQSVSHYSLQRTIYDAKYYMQAAIYQRAASLMGYDHESYFIIAVESAAPHHVQVVELEPHYVARGHIEWENLLEQWKRWDGSVRHSLDEDDEAGWQMDAPSWVPPLDIGI